MSQFQPLKNRDRLKFMVFLENLTTFSAGRAEGGGVWSDYYSFSYSNNHLCIIKINNKYKPCSNGMKITEL